MVAEVSRRVESFQYPKSQPIQIIIGAQQKENTQIDLLEGAGFKIYLKSQIPLKEDGSYDWQYFRGFTVVDAGNGHELGVIDSVDDATENVLFEIGDLLVPAADDLILDIDHEGKTIKMQLPEGLTEL